MSTFSFRFHIKLCSICDHLSRTTHSLHKCIIHVTRKNMHVIMKPLLWEASLYIHHLICLLMDSHVFICDVVDVHNIVIISFI